MTKKKIVFILIFIISLVPRIIELFSDNNFFGFEQGLQYLITKEIFVGHKFILLAFQGGFGEILKPAGFNYLLGIPFILASGDPFGGRIFMFVISALTILLAIILTDRMFKFPTAFFICFLLAISSNMSHLAGKMDTPALIPSLAVLLVFCIPKILSGSKKFLLLSAFIIGTTAHFEMATSGKLIALFIILLVYLFVKKVISYKHLLLTFLFLAIPLLPLFIFDFFHNFQNINGILKLFEASGKHVGQASAILSSNIIFNRLDVFRWNFLSTFSPYFLIWPLIILWICGGSFIYLKKKKGNVPEKILVQIFTIIPFIYFAMLIFYPANIVQWWLFELAVFYCYLLGIILGYFWNKKYLRLLILLTLALLFTSFIHRTAILYKERFVFYRAPDTYIRETEPIKYIFNDAKGKRFDIKVFSPNPPANYEYLIWWYGTNKYHSLPDVKNNKILYIIFEKKYTLSLKDKKFLETLGSETVISSKIFKSGFTVKKAIYENK